MFKQFHKHSSVKPIVLHLMLAITTHWLTFLALKTTKHVQYWFFDSHNHHYLDFGHKEIVELIERKSKERTKYGKPELTTFQQEAYTMCIKDIQTSLKLIIDCIEGTNTIDGYSYNYKFSLFAEPLQAAIAADYFSVAFVVREYKHNIRSFFGEGVQWELLNNKSRALLREIVEYSNKIKNVGDEGKLLYSLVVKQQKNCGVTSSSNL
jgi:hypothetical protein